VSLTILAPISGTILPLADVPDPVFAQGMMGPGLAIDPADEATQALAPVSGTVVKVHPHAAIIEADDGRGLLFHLGIDTVEMEGDSFTVHVTDGAEVTAGDVLITWSPAAVRARSLSPITPVVALQAATTALRPTGATAVKAGDHLFTWD
jgi:PTS system N-acetylglucosamine-specific IIA component